MENKQTAVEWLVYELKSYTFHERIDMAEWEELKKLSRKAKQMEKEQISQGYMAGLIDGMNQQPREYYNETYNK